MFKYSKKLSFTIFFALLAFISFFLINTIVRAAGELEQWTANGVNVTNDGIVQDIQFSVLDGSGGMFVAWRNTSDLANPIGTQGVYLHRYDTNGAAIWGAPVKIFANTHVLRGLEQDGSGGVVVLASNGFTNIQAARVDSGGTIAWTSTVFTSSTSLANRINFTKDSSNNFFVIFDERVQKFDLTGTVAWGANGVDYNETALGFYTSATNTLPIIPLENGGAAVVWMTNSAGERDIYAQVINSAGTPLGSSIAVSTSVGVIEGAPTIALADGTNFYVAYAQETGTNVFDVKIKKYDTSGVNQFAASGITLQTGMSMSSTLANAYSNSIVHPNTDEIVFTGQGFQRIFRVSTAGSVIWSTNKSSFPVTFNGSYELAFNSNEDEVAIVLRGFSTNPHYLATLDFDSGTRHSAMPISNAAVTQTFHPDANIHPGGLGFYMSWLYAPSTSFPIPYDVYIQEFSSQNYGPFQIAGITGTNDVTYFGASVKDGSGYGVDGGIVPISITDQGKYLVDIDEVDMTANRDWSTLEAVTDTVNNKAYFSGLTGLPGMVSTTHDLYIPRAGEARIGICPNATDISEVNAACSGFLSLTLASPGVSAITLDGQDYWLIEDTTYKAGFAANLYTITNLDSGLDVFNVADDANMESAGSLGQYTVRIVHTASSRILAELDIAIGSNLNWSTLQYGSAGGKTYLSNVTSLPGFQGSNYDIFVPNGAEDTNVYTCPTAASYGDVDPDCAGVVDLGLSAANLTQETIDTIDYWRYSNFAGTNLGREYTQTLLGDILIVYNDALTTNNSAQQMYDLLDGLGYDVTLNGVDGVPSFETLDSYKAVIYTQGDGYGLDGAQVAILKDYMDNGKGKIFFEGEEFQYDAGDTDFSENYMRTTDVGQDFGDPGTITVTGAAHPVTAGLPASSAHVSTSGYSDALDPINGSETLILGDFGGSPEPILIAYDNGLTCTESKKTVTYTAIWQNATLGISDATFRETLLVNTVDWLLDNPCTVDSLPAAYNLTAEINSTTVDLETTGAEGAVTGNLKTATNAPLADIGITFTDNLNWSTLNLDVDAVNSKIFSGNILDMDGAGNQYTLYVPIAPAHAAITQVSICVGAANLAAVTNTCSGIGTLTDGQTATISGQLLTANIENIGGSNYWVISGFTAAAGALVTEPAEESPVEDGGETGGTTTPPTTPTGQGSSAPTSFPVVTTPVSSPTGDDSEVPQEDEETTGGGIVDDETEGSESGNIVSDIFNSITSFIEDTLNISPEILAGAVLATAAVTTAAIATGGVANYSAYFFGVLIWRKRKYWGLIYEIGSFSGLGLVTVRVYKKELGKLTFINQTVSDFEGKYGLNISEPGEYTVEFIREGFKTVTKTLAITRGKDIILDIGMQRTDNEALSIVTQIRYFWKENAPVIMQVLRFIVIVLMFWGLSTALNALSVTPSIGNYIVTGLYIALILLQLWLILTPYFGYKTGSIVDTTKKPLKGAILRLISMDTNGAGVENLGISNSNGIVKLRTNAGQYQFIARLLGYQTASGVTAINESGKLSKTIELAKAEGTASEFGVL